MKAPAAVKGYTRETGRTELINEVRLRHASIPTTIYQDSVVESVPSVVEQVHEPLVHSARLLRSPLYSHLIKK